MKRDFMEIGEDLYEILRKIREDHNPIAETWKEHLMADKVFRKDGYLFFCRTVQEAQLIKNDRVQKLDRDTVDPSTGDGKE